MTVDQIKKLTDDMPLVQALWWYIENMPVDSPDRSEVFFHLRYRMRNYDPHAVGIGNPFDVLSLIGPFDTNDDAAVFGESHNADNWYIAPLQSTAV